MKSSPYSRWVSLWLTAWAFRAIRLFSAWRKTWSSFAVGTISQRIISRSTLPGPTDGSWSGSPTNRSLTPGFKRSNRAWASRMSTILHSSTTTKSADKNSAYLDSMSSSQRSPIAECSVDAGKPVCSLILLLALPVGAASRISCSGNTRW